MSPEMATPDTFEVTVVIDFGCLDRRRIETRLTVAAMSTVFDALRIAAPVITSRKFGMDHFVESICGIGNDLSGTAGWSFAVNGERSNVPAERYLVKRADRIEWQYIDEP